PICGCGVMEERTPRSDAAALPIKTPDGDAVGRFSGRPRPGYRLLATVPNTAFKLVPTVVIVATAATAIRAAINPYSIAVAPSSFLKSLTSVDNINASWED